MHARIITRTFWIILLPITDVNSFVAEYDSDGDRTYDIKDCMKHVTDKKVLDQIWPIINYTKDDISMLLEGIRWITNDYTLKLYLDKLLVLITSENKIGYYPELLALVKFFKEGFRDVLQELNGEGLVLKQTEESKRLIEMKNLLYKNDIENLEYLIFLGDTKLTLSKFMSCIKRK